ncbi:OmpH family outer membrane protein [Xanthomarina sp. F1114]|uniref:OmpH family outer membrane protein n=1 Tax=Xanthomarina sp. F1114 TaxID=2996019 RepID=UPI00225E17B9|nr:OmpH family outer membrane protein [Xanthomarina sp. F1114]MCX7546764.1 OmpH family outer membrane protein [Xanthomarina sp. F1114]
MTQIKLKVLFLLIIVSTISISAHAQRGVRIGYIDTEYILQNIPEYQEATAQLDNKVQKWKTEIETQLSAIEQKRKDLSNEKALLTKELIEEREEDITFEEKEILDYQQKRFGPNGDLMIQKKQLIQPIQDQIFAAVQDMAEKRKYDFVFDKAADVVMLYSADRFDFSDEVIRSISRSAKRTQAQTRQERKAAEAEENLPEINEEQEAREKAAEERRELILSEREQKQLEAQKRRDSIIQERQRLREEKINARNAQNEETTITEDGEVVKEGEPVEQKSREEILEERRQQKLKDREERQKELDARRQKILEDRQKAKEERERQRQEAQENKNTDGKEPEDTDNN